jgi:hypothetical protein
MPLLGQAFMPTLIRSTETQHPWIAIASVCVGACLMLGALPVAAQMPTQATMRSLTGTVTDTSHEPIGGAIVELRNESSHSLVTFITEANGNYNFKRLDGNTDYVVWVVFRGKHSPTHTISKFDSHMEKVIDFKVSTF